MNYSSECFFFALSIIFLMKIIIAARPPSLIAQITSTMMTMGTIPFMSMLKFSISIFSSQSDRISSKREL